MTHGDVESEWKRDNALYSKKVRSCFDRIRKEGDRGTAQLLASNRGNGLVSTNLHELMDLGVPGIGEVVKALMKLLLY